MMPAEVGSTQEDLQQSSPHWSSPLDISQIIYECRNAEPSPGTANECPVMQLHPDRLGTQTAEFWAHFKSLIKITSLKDPTMHSLMVLF